MSADVSRYVVGTAALTVLFVLACVVGVARGPAAGDATRLRRLRIVAAATIAAQLLHFVEELHSGFYLRFPLQLGLPPWSGRFFVTFNLAWLAIWIAALLAVRVGRTAVLIPLWFLALAEILNGIAHPLLSLRVQGYFPGLYTSPLVGVAGVLLLYQLVRATGNPSRTPSSTHSKPSANTRS